MFTNSIRVCRNPCIDDFIIRGRIRSLEWQYLHWSNFMRHVAFYEQDVPENILRCVAVIKLYGRLRRTSWSRSYYG